MNKLHDYAKKSVNFVTGCEYDCKYCYAKGRAIRLKQVEEGQWVNMKVRQHDFKKKHKNYGEIVMFPSSHDITLTVLPEVVIVLGKLLKAGNKVLVVSKPRLECIERLCSEFDEFKENILFRFTIGARNSDVIKFWEPDAPSYDERKQALRYAFEKGFATSVSMEPILDMDDVLDVFFELEPFVSDTIWLGKMNHIRKNINFTGPEAGKL
jgi:DNA repair photolyase